MRDQFAASGTNVSEWARTRGFSIKMTHEILRGERRCIRGQSHRIAVALGLKHTAAPPAPLATANDDRPAPTAPGRYTGAEA